MKITRLFSGSDGESYFGDLEIPLEDKGDIGRLSEVFGASGIIFRETDGNYDYDFHNAPNRQYIVLLEGEIEITTSLGDIRRFSSGDIILAEDIEGKGHKTRSIDGKLRRSIFITV
jgi:hypothetical protein